jgi:uncharacterized membrane protein YhaH (DUF805 family)
MGYWAYTIGAWTAILALLFAFGVFDSPPALMENGVPADGTMLLFGLLNIPLALYLWTGFAVHAKRWHDRGKSGWWSLIGLIPPIGGIWILVECGFLKGADGPNRYGEDPRGAILVEVFE